MEYRFLGNSGLRVPVLSIGTATFAGGDRVGSWGDIQLEEARRIIGIAMDAGANFFDTADVYSGGRAEEVLGQAISGRRDQVLIGTKASFRGGAGGPNDVGSSRSHLVRALEGSLRRLGTDFVDIYYLHGFDAFTPQEEVLSTLDQFVRDGKVRYIGCSNFSGWQLMKSLSISDRYGWSRHVAHQVHYSLAAREFEWELMPLNVDQQVGAVVWSPLSQARLTGKVRRGGVAIAESRLVVPTEVTDVEDEELLYDIVDVLVELAEETGKSIPQIALNWLLHRPTVSSIILGVRTEKQLADNLGALGWALTPSQVARLDQVSSTRKIYPYWHQVRNFGERNPGAVPVAGS
jgi:aryl-alcohol dehydrogenase-like predicted oxidoreductase